MGLREISGLQVGEVDAGRQVFPVEDGGVGTGLFDTFGNGGDFYAIKIR